MGRAKKFRAMANGARKDGPQRNDEAVARNLRRFRIARGLSQTELGNAVGVTFQQVQKYEKAKNAVAPGRLRQMCEILGVTPANIFGSQPEVDGETCPEMSSWRRAASGRVFVPRPAVDTLAEIAPPPDRLGRGGFYTTKTQSGR